MDHISVNSHLSKKCPHIADAKFVHTIGYQFFLLFVDHKVQRKAARLAELNAVLNIDDKRPPERLPESVPEAEIAKAARPSVLQRLNAVPDQEQHSQATHRKQEVVL